MSENISYINEDIKSLNSQLSELETLREKLFNDLFITRNASINASTSLVQIAMIIGDIKSKLNIG